MSVAVGDATLERSCDGRPPELARAAGRRLGGFCTRDTCMRSATTARASRGLSPSRVAARRRQVGAARQEPTAWRGVAAVSFPEQLCMTVSEQIPRLDVARGDQSHA